MGSAAAATADLDEAVSPRQTNSMLDKAMHGFPTATRAVNHALDTIHMRADPDAQATVTDFLDFTEYLPSDMTRSLTLIGKLDQTYIDASLHLHDLTTKWSQLPILPPEERPAPLQLRADISETLSSAVSSRVYSHAEASRMADNVAKHYNRAKSILAKLKTMRENWPPPEEMKSPVAARSPQLTRTPKATLRADGQRVRRQQVPRITVPGEVLAPYELNYETFGSDSESSSEEGDEAVPRPPSRATTTPAPQPRIRIVKNPKPPKTPKTPKVRNSVSVADGTGFPRELSTSKILARLQPPPENAVPGSADAPWLQLTTYELAKLRKRMKKNAAWAPSDTMIARELKILGRGVESYNAAKKKAEEEGRPFEDNVPSLVVDAETGATVMPPGALSMEAMAAEEKNLSNRGMKLNEAKRSKREQDLARLAAEEAEASARWMQQAAKAMFTPSQPPSIPDQTTSQAKPDRKPRQKKRKRESVGEADAEKPDGLETQAQRPQFKRTKTETPVPHPQLGAQPSQESQHLVPSTAPLNTRTAPVPVPVPGQDQSARAQVTASPASGTNGASPANSGTAPAKPPTETPILPPVRETRKSQAARLQEPQPASTPAATTSTSAAKPPSRGATPAARPATPATDQTESSAAPQATISGPATRRPASRGGKAASQEPHSDRPRRASTARNTPAPPDGQPARPASRRQSKRPAPGVVSRTNSGGNSAVGRRKAAPKKKTAAGSRASAAAATGGANKAKDNKGSGGGGVGDAAVAVAGSEAVQEVEYDDDGKVVDPDEPRYCLCNRVSFGTMIQCDNDTCKLEWFHLECIGLSDVPARTTKWYCPDCRVLLKIGEKGEVNARGVRT